MPCLLVLDNAPTAAVRHKTLCDALQKMLGTAVGVAYDANGKPSLTGYPPLRYLSVTTTGDYMVAALAGSPLGIDGERRDRFACVREGRFLAVAERFFTPEDYAFVRSDPRRFGEVWVRREAYVKYTGAGIREFSAFSVSDGNELLPEVCGVPVGPLAVPLADKSDYLFAVAGGKT